MDNELFNFREVSDVVLKTILPVEINGKQLEAGETVAVFDKIQSMSISGKRQLKTARGGWNNKPLVFFDNQSEASVYLSQGVFSKDQMSLMNNSRLYTVEPDKGLYIPWRETLESDENGDIQLSFIPSTPFFLYDVETGEKLPFEYNEGRKIHIEEQYKTVIADYYYDYNGGYKFLSLGRCATYGFFDLTGRTRVKDDTSGATQTGIIHIPKLKLLTDISIRVGKTGIPTIDRIEGVAIPCGSRGNSTVCEMFFLDDDIESDIGYNT